MKVVKINDKNNDFVCTPSDTAKLMGRLAQIKDTDVVLDPCAGTGDLLDNVPGKKIAIEIEEDIHRILVEKYPDAILGSCLDWDGNADFILANPPYSVSGKGFSLLEPIMSKIKSGKAIILIQESAGSGQGGDYTKSILKHSSLIASIKMPSDLFIGKAGVQTSIFMFQLGVPHNPESLVKFIDFSNDGYIRGNRKKASREINLRDDGTATERSEELFALIYNRKRKTNHLDVVEDTITLNGDDWTFGQHKKINTNADINDFFTITSNYIDSSVKNKFVDFNVDFDVINKLEESFIEQGLEFKSFKVEDVFELIATNKLSYKANDYKIKTTTADLPATTCSNQNQMLTCYVPRKGATILKNCISVTANGDATCYYQPSEFTVLQDSYAIKSKINCSENSYLYFVSVLQKLLKSKYSWTNKSGWNKVKEELIMLPAINGEISFDYMEKHIEKLKQKYVEELICNAIQTGKLVLNCQGDLLEKIFKKYLK